VAPHVDPLLCEVTAVGELLLWDVSREGLPLLDLIKTKDPRLKQIRLFWKQRTNCTADMAYHQMAPILSNALEACQLSKTKVSCCWSGWRRVARCCGLCRPLHAHHLHAHAPGGPADHSLLLYPPLQCMHLFRDTSPVLLATGGASLSLIELHCR
jgi:hypothetical protein